MIFPESETHNLDTGPTVTVPAGNYIVLSGSSGAMYLLTYATETEARAEFTKAENAYSVWIEDESEQ